MENKKIINAGGVNGLGENSVNTNAKDFKKLLSTIKEISSNQSKEERIDNEFLSIRFQIESYLTSTTNEIILAGEFIEKYLAVIKIKKKDFAKYINYEETNLSALLKGRRKINLDIALKLGKIFKINPEVWLHIESKNDLIKQSKKNERGL
ncbi:MAG: hypothetical protein MI974_14365 [Chitinophagales bacterium]|nr:hypothetical protein [Chitinophagales bacterium]